MDIKNFVVSNEALQALDNGAWVGDLEGAPGVRFLVRGLKSDPVRKAQEAKQAKMRASKKGKPLTDDDKTQIFKETIAEQVLLGWDGFESGGEPLPYDANLARTWIMERNGEAFTTLVITAAQSLDGNPDDFIQAAAKN